MESELTKEGLQEAIQRLDTLAVIGSRAVLEDGWARLMRQFIVPRGTIDVVDEKPFDDAVPVIPLRINVTLIGSLEGCIRVWDERPYD